MKKFGKLFILIALALMIACVFVACNENTKQAPISTGDTYTTVTSNGGVAVQYGNYLYFVNGYAGESALNTFGDVEVGAICRVDIVKDGAGVLSFDYKSFKVIVPKNVYGTDTTNAGIYIVDGYIYYHTTSIDKDSKRQYKTDEGVLMRTSVDGSKTDVIENFSDNATVFRVADNYLVYIVTNADSETKPYAVRLSDFSKKEIDSANVLAYQFSDNYMVYTTYNTARTSDSSSDYLVKLFNFSTGETTLLMDSNIYNQEKAGYLFTTTIKTILETKDRIYLFYSKSDNSNDKLYEGYYFCSFLKSNPKYSVANEYRMTVETHDTTYDRFFRLENGTILAYHDKVIDIYDTFQGGVDTFGTATRKASDDPKNNGAYLSYELTGASALVDIYEKSGEVYAYFTTTDSSDSSKTTNSSGSSKTTDSSDSSKTILNYIKLFEKKQDGTYKPTYENVAKFFRFKSNSSYTKYEVSDLYYYDSDSVVAAKAVVYLNSDLGDCAFPCAYIIQNGSDQVNDKDNEHTGTLIGKIQPEKLVDIISSGPVDEE